MMKNLPIALVVLMTAALHAQTVNLHGIVSNKAGKPVAKAAVSVTALGISDTTGSDGVYVIAKAPNVGISQAFASGRVTVQSGVLELALGRPEPVRIDILDLKGNLLQSEAPGMVPSGTYRLRMGESASRCGVVLIRARIGEAQVRLRAIPGVGAVGAQEGAAPSQAGVGLARSGAFSDTLKVMASGYATAKVAITSYDQTLNVTLDTALAAAVPSAGCGKALGSLKTGAYKITSKGTARDYMLDIPASYDPKKPYRLIFCWHWMGGSMTDVSTGQTVAKDRWSYFGLKRLADSAGQSAIFIAPQGIGTPPWSTYDNRDHVLFDDLLAYAKTNLCIDTTRVFATGFSFGAMQTYSLSTNHQGQLRAVATLAAANYNIYLPTNTHRPIAYLGMTGMSDGTCPFINNASQQKGGFYAAAGHATDNGCTVPASIPTTTVGSKSHVVYDFQNCKQGYPVKMITFDGGHIAAPADGGTGDNGTTTWAPRETWKFFTQF